MRIILLLVIAIGLFFSSCTKEQKMQNEGFNQSTNIDYNQIKRAAEGRTFYVDRANCEPPATACGPDIDIPASHYCYVNLKNAIKSSQEHKFFTSEDAPILFPWLFDEGWNDCLLKLQDANNKLILFKNVQTGTEYYVCVNDRIGIKDYKPGMEYAVLPIIVE